MLKLSQEKWEALKPILAELGIKAESLSIHAGDPTKPTGVSVRIATNTKFLVSFEEKETPKDEPKKKSKFRP